MSEVYRHAPTHCPVCNHKIDAATGAGQGPPGPPRVGDWTVCFGCTAILIYDGPASLRKMEIEDRGANPTYHKHAMDVVARLKNYKRQCGDST